MLIKEVDGTVAILKVNRPKQAKKALDLGADIYAALGFDFEASKECFFAGDALSKAKTF